MCIVGNGPVGASAPGEDVDGHDVVVRFNDMQLDGPLGRRVDVYVTTFRHDVRTSPLEMINLGARLATLSRAAIPESIEGRVDVWEDAARALEIELGCWPSSGLAAFYEAVRQRARRITLVAMNLAPPFAGGGTRGGSAPRGSMYHNFVGERRVFAALVRKAQAFGIALSLTPELLAGIPGPRGSAPPPEQVDALLAAMPDVSLDRLRVAGRSDAGRSGFVRVVQAIASTFPADFRVVLGDSRTARCAALCRGLERYLFLPRGKRVRGHPWWLHDASLCGEVEQLAAALRRAARGFAWMAPPDLEDALRAALPCDGPLSLLGVGVEGPVLSDGRHVFKCLTDPDNWTPHDAILRSLPGRPFSGALPRVERVASFGETLVVASLYEAYEPYHKVGPSEWRAFLDGMRRAGLCARNIKASNLVHVNGGLRFVDLGNSLRLWSEREAEEMAIRCYLLDKFGPREDLVDLMHVCVDDRSHPALDGLPEFLAAVGLAQSAPPRPLAAPQESRVSGGDPPYTLLIKLCAMDHELGPDFVAHLSRSLGRSGSVREVLVVVDTREDGFPRQFAVPDRRRLLERLHALRKAGAVHRIVEVPNDAAVRDTYARWFGLAPTAERAPDTHANNGQQLFATLYGIDACSEDRVIALDGDMLFWRRSGFAGWQGRVEEAFRLHPEAVFVSPPICRSSRTSSTTADERGPYRPCPRASVIARDRLRTLLPAQAVADAAGRLPAWHRILHGIAPVVRLHDDDWGLIHTPNVPCKQQPLRVLEIMDRVEDGWCPPEQLDAQDLVWDGDWDGPAREEPFVFVVAGRNVSGPRLTRCIESLRRQAGGPWGAIVIDDCSDGDAAARLREAVQGDPRFTVIRNRRRRGYLPNLVRAVRSIMRRPESVAVLVDMDDCLIGDGVIRRLAREYDRSADLTVGSMLRTDKSWRYPPDFDHPRSTRGNAWQHLRTFRKALFDRLPLDVLRRPDGTWYDVGTDWAFMVPLVELASNPRYIKDTLYYYDVQPKSEERRRLQRETMEEILGRPPLRPHAGQREGR